MEDQESGGAEEKWILWPEKILDFEWTCGADTIYKIKKDSITVFSKKKPLAKLYVKPFLLIFNKKTSANVLR
jgi:hypothetical protein